MFRYDDTPHFPALPTFPHHKHTQETVIAHNKPDLLDVLHEAAEWA
ncbi:toxin-antitoxin system TumE family protein [Thiothrix subterranea]